jgi:Ca-activated chloride channel family protein
MAGKGKLKVVFVFIAIAVSLLVVIYGGIALTRNLGKSSSVVSEEKAASTLEKLYGGIKVTEMPLVKGQANLAPANISDSLPDISKYPPQVDNTTDNYVEIFSSTEKAGSGNDGWLTEVAQKFNQAKISVNGKTASVRLRGIASGVGTDYIIAKKYLPDAFTPSNEFWGQMIQASGVPVKLVEKKLAGNVPGILLSKSKHAELTKKYGSINMKTITEAVSANEIAMGYTNPFASSTGLNFLVSCLYAFDSDDLLSEKAVAGFEAFQTNIPFVSYTTLQMTDAVRTGALDGFIMEYQTYQNTPDLMSGYIFTPFGVRHDSPMYEIGNLSAEKQAVLKAFIDFTQNEASQKSATAFGFNNLNNYRSEMGSIDGATISQAQRLWKEKKNANREIIAVFVSDVSGSMEGDPLKRLKESLLSSAAYITNESSIGLVSFADDVFVDLPIAKFDLNQRSLFAGAVESMQAGGSTAMYDGIVVGAKMLMDKKAENPNAKLMLFVLTDGETNLGYTLNDVSGVLKQLRIPVYSIGYNANIESLQVLSSINEAASINADSDEVVYKLGSLFNAQF